MDLYNDNGNNNDSSDRPVFLSMAMPAREAYSAAPSLVRTTQPQDAKTQTKHAIPDSTANNATTITSFEDMDTMMMDGSLESSSFARTTWATDKLCRLAYFHPLERTHTKFARPLLEDVLKRLTTTLYKLSCQVHHDTDRLVATCLGMDGVEFQIAVWEARTNENNNNDNSAQSDNLILEMQRVAGDAFAFHRKYATSLLKIPCEMDLPVAEHERHTLSADPATARRQGLALDRLPATPVDEIDHVMELATGMVMSDRYDAVKLGLESLQFMTCPQSSSWKTAVRVAQSIGNQPALAATLWEFAVEDDRSDEATSLVALQMWVNAWQVLAAWATQGNDTVTFRLNQRQVVAALLARVAAVQTHPHHAALACAALDALVQLEGANHKNNGPKVVAQQIHWNLVSKAHAFGCAQHAALQQASQRLLQTAGVGVVRA